MSLKNVTLALAASYLAANVLMKRKRAGNGGSGIPPTGGPERAEATSMGPLGAAPTSSDAAAPGDAIVAGADIELESPNAGERINATGSGAASADAGSTGNLFDSNSQDGPEPKTPGLPDMFRGA